MQTIFYARVSTTEQTLSHQQRQAESAGYTFDQVVVDHGVSGVAVKMKDRPEGRRLFDMLRPGDILVVRWVDRLGRNYQDVTDTIREFMRRGVTICTIINGMRFDGRPTDPMQEAVRDALIAFMAATAQAHAEATKEAQQAGIAEAKRAGNNAYRGRKPSFTRRQLEDIIDLQGKGTGVAEIARTVGVSRQTVYRVKNAPGEAHSALEAWNM